jgi:3-isopropylmalate dehydrogenase
LNEWQQEERFMPRVLVLPGDGIGPEVIEPTVEILQASAKLLGLPIELILGKIGGSAIDALGSALPDETRQQALEADAILVGAVGGPSWDHLPLQERPERGLIDLRKTLGLYANLRHGYVYRGLESTSPLREVLVRNTDILLIRELSGGLYRGPHIRDSNQARDETRYEVSEIERVAHLAFQLAQGRRGKVTSVDKAQVLATSWLWRDTVNNVSAEYPDIDLEHMYVDNAAQHLVRSPRDFDVVLTEVAFGDILSDLMGGIVGSIGLLPSAALGSSPRGLYEPIHGSGTRMVGQNRANPIATIACLPMMMEYSFDQPLVAKMFRGAIQLAIDSGARTRDLDQTHGITAAEMGKRIHAALEESLERAVEDQKLKG